MQINCCSFNLSRPRFRPTIASRVCLLVCLLVCLFVCAAAQAQFSQLISIGDSLSDTGNTQDVTFGVYPGSGYSSGRFSNGQLWNELLAIELGLTAPTPLQDGGTNYAHGGALTSQDYVEVILFFITITLPSATSQIFDFLSDVGNSPDPNAIYTLSIGGNDILDAGEALAINATQQQIDAARQEMQNIAESLEVALQQLLSNLSNGDARIVLMNVPNVGITPRASNEGKQGIYQQLSIAYNQGLANVVSSVNDSRVLLVDFFSLTNDVAANPQAYGLTNVTNECLLSGSVCATPDTYLFWDDIHPTTMGHTLLMMQVYDQLFAPTENVPFPPAHLAFLFATLLLVAYSVKLQKRQVS